jgi:sulfofructose kinase
MKRFDVAGLGQCSVDFLATVAAYPPVDVKAETSAFVMQGGGPVATALVAAARLGLRTVFLGKIGGDPYGRFIQDGLSTEGICLEGLITAPDRTSQTAFIAVEQATGKRTIFWNRGRRSRWRSMKPSSISFDRAGFCISMASISMPPMPRPGWPAV